MSAIPVQSVAAALMGATLPPIEHASEHASSITSAGSGSVLHIAVPSIASAASPAAAPQAPFADLVTEAVGQVQQYESQAKSAIEGMMTGQGVDVHQAMIATEKAESGFELVLAVRNKALAAYQQVMGMQF